MPILRKVPKRENIVARLERLRELNAMHVIKQAVPLKSITKLSENSEAVCILSGIRVIPFHRFGTRDFARFMFTCHADCNCFCYQ